MIDTNIAIELVNGDARLIERVALLPSVPLMSIVTRVELEGGVYANAAAQDAHRGLLDALLTRVEELPFTREEAIRYGRIVASLGFSRRLVIDRMIAAQAIAIEARLATLNARDFQGVPELLLEDWSG